MLHMPEAGGERPLAAERLLAALVASGGFRWRWASEDNSPHGKLRLWWALMGGRFEAV